jgi:energy-coupling factor transport system permease protein
VAPTALVDIYVSKPSPLHRVDPRIKIISAVLLTLVCFFLSNLLVLIALLVVMQALVRSTRVSMRAYSSSFLLVARFSIILMLIWPFFDQAGTPLLLDLWVYKPTAPALLRALAIALRIFIIASAWLILLLTTRHGQLVRGFVKLGCPYDFGISLSIALRYLPNFLGTIDQIKEAQSSRGLEISRGNIVKRARNMIPVLIPAFAIAFRAIDGLSEALLSRGYGASPTRTYYRDIRMRASDSAILVSMVFLASLVIAVELLGVANL